MSELKIPLFDITFDDNEKKAIKNVLDSGWLTMGDKTKEFEKEFAHKIGCKYAFAVANGSVALHIAHKLFNIKEGDEIITTAFTFVATSNSIIHCGGQVRFADICGLNDLNISPDDVEKKITKKTKGITIMHYGGNPCDMEKLTAIAKKHNLFIIEDSAHAHGVEYNGKHCGVLGDVGCFSFFSNKNLVTGEGGMITTNNDMLAKKIPLLRSHGMTSLTLDRHKGHSFSYDVVELGYNYRLDEMRSALGLEQLKKLEDNNDKRKIIDRLYRKELKGNKNIIIPFNNNNESSYHIFPIILDGSIDRKDFMTQLRKQGIQTSIHYPPIHKFHYYQKTFGKDIFNLPLTEEAGKREVTLPMYPEMKENDVKFVSKCVLGYLNDE